MLSQALHRKRTPVGLAEPFQLDARSDGRARRKGAERKARSRTSCFAISRPHVLRWRDACFLMPGRSHSRGQPMNHLTDERFEDVLRGSVENPDHRSDCAECRAHLAEECAWAERVRGTFASLQASPALAARIRNEERLGFNCGSLRSARILASGRGEGNTEVRAAARASQVWRLSHRLQA